MRKLLLFALVLTAFQSSAYGRGKALQQVQAEGIYWTPVSPELSRYAVFNVDGIEIKKFRDRIKVEYTLPVELTGVPNEIELEGSLPRNPEQPLVLEGEHGRAECASVNDFSNCALTYKNLTIDAETRTAVLKAISKSPTELEMREAVAMRFCPLNVGGEPCGFLRVLNYGKISP